MLVGRAALKGRRRLDVELVRRGLAPSRTQGQELISQGKVLVNGAIADNAARQVGPGDPVVIAGPKARYVSRGGEKLAAALSNFGLAVQDKRALDVGASTGGFTDCLLQHGAVHVVAVDVGRGQMHERLRADSRVEVTERTNIRHVTIADLGGLPFDLITADVSFISLKTIAPVLVEELSRPGTDIVTLIKPQFEAGRVEVSKGKGVISDPDVWRRVLADVVTTMSSLRAATMGLMKSPLLGAEGNVEFLGWFRVGHVEDSAGNRPTFDLADNFDRMMEEGAS